VPHVVLQVLSLRHVWCHGRCLWAAWLHGHGGHAACSVAIVVPCNVVIAVLVVVIVVLVVVIVVLVIVIVVLVIVITVSGCAVVDPRGGGQLCIHQ
jgi:hypothetical protein